MSILSTSSLSPMIKENDFGKGSPTISELLTPITR